MASTESKSSKRHSLIRARQTTTSFDTAEPHEQLCKQSVPVQLVRKSVTKSFDAWVKVSTAICRRLGWYPRVEPYVSYGTEHYSRLICRTVLSPPGAQTDSASRGIRAALTVPAPYTRVSLAIDLAPIKSVQLGDFEYYDAPDSTRNQSSSKIVSDRSGYLDLLVEHNLSVGLHELTYRVPGRSLVSGDVYTIASSANIGVISDVDDTILVTQATSKIKATYNMFLSNPAKRVSVPGMSALYRQIHDLDPQIPFFYLSASPWNVERTIRLFIRDHGYPPGPLLLRDLDPRPKTFIPSTVQHKYEFIHQLMSDFPKMRFILFGDDGQCDPATYAEVVRRYPGRIICIGIRQLRASETGLSTLALSKGHLVPETDVPIFYGTSGGNFMKTMLPYLHHVCHESRI